MTPMNKLRTQHKDILALTDRITACLETETDHDPVLMDLIRELGALLEKHLLLEDDFLYPILKKHPQQNIRDIAALFSTELGGFKNTFSEYLVKWNSSENIAQSRPDFISESNALLDTLRVRIDKEDNELFPLVEV